MPKTTDLIPTSVVAQMLAVDVTTVNRWARAGRLPVAFKGPGRTSGNLFRRGDVDAFRTDRRRSDAA